VLLTRNNKAGILLANFLTENNIPVISSESLLIDTSSEVQFLLHMLQYLNNRKNIEALANALYYLAKNAINNIKTHDFIHQGLQYKTEAELEEWLQNFGIRVSFQNSRKKSLYEVVEFLVSKCIKSENNNAYVQYFLDIVLERDVKNQMNISDFLDYWNKHKHKISVPSAEGSNAIRIMTIHKSKGLEFLVVIFPFAEEDFSRNKKEKIWLDSSSSELNFDKFLIDKSSKVIDYGEDAARVYQQKSQEDLLDNTNVLYVALTRAEEQLYVISSYKDKNKTGDLPNNLASFFIEFLETSTHYDPNVLTYEFGLPERTSEQTAIKSKQKSIKSVSEVINPSHIKIAQREAMMWGSNQLRAIEFGNVLHEILSFIKNKNDIQIAITKALENGLITESQKEEVSQTITEIVHHPDLIEFFDADMIVYKEQNILKKNFKTIKPDRVTIKNKSAYLLDYKTGKHQAKYTQQLNEYEFALQEMGFQVQKKVLIYIGENLEIVHL
jgi:ATP-dependent exoDNAse (exonuclease V) beta subunit